MEIAGPAGTNLANWSIVLYNGAGGASYDTDVLSGTIPDQQAGVGTMSLAYPSNGIQNGAPDGIALVDPSATVVQFLTYEGTFAATNGPASGLTGTDIGVFENGTDAVGLSLQLTGTGSTYQDFTWAAAGPSTFDAPNTGQTFAGGDVAPFLASSAPADGASGVAANATLSITFSEPVTIDAGSVVLVCASVDQGASVAAGPDTTFTLDYGPPLPDGAACTITIVAAGVRDVDDPPDPPAGDIEIDFTVALADPCAGVVTAIPAIQGSGPAAAITGPVTTEGVVIGDYEGPSPTLRGFYIQDPDGDGDAATSDGIFVFNGSDDDVQLGDLVRVTGTAAEFQDQTQVSATSMAACGTGASLTPVDVTFPVASATFLERFEGMLVRLPQTLSVTEHFQLGRFGQVVLSADGRVQQPTAVVAPGAAANAMQAANDRHRIIIDDALQSQNPDPILFGRGGNPLSASNTLRGGDTATGIVGVMTYTWAGNAASGNAYRVRPIGAMGGAIPDFQPANPRPAASPDVGGAVQVAGMNLLNYFNTFSGCTFGVGGAAADCRGANNATEFDRQSAKTVAAIVALGADVVGVNEIENDGYGPTSAIADLVSRLNSATTPGMYAYIDVDAAAGRTNALGTDAIKVGMIYRPAVVTPVGQTAALDTVAFVNGGDSAPRSRPSLAQAFQTVDGARFILDVNHLKSKGSACDAPDAGDGQGNCNVVRTNAAHALVDWLATDPTGTGDDDVVIVGDLNSYAREDPVAVLEGAGYTNLVAAFVDDPYSYVFDGQWGYLDYALGSAAALDEVAGIGEWHINADEPAVLDYNTEFKSAGQVLSLYAPDQFRVSDHDPILVGLDPVNDPPSVDAGGPYTVVEHGSVIVSATGADPEGTAVSFAWDLDGVPGFEASGQQVSFSAATLEAPLTRTIRVRVTDAFGREAIDETTVRVIWSFAFRQPVQAPPTVNLWIAGLPVLVPFSLSGNQGLGVLDGAPRFTPTTCDTHQPTGPSTAISTIGGALFYERRTDSYWFLWRTARSLARTCGTLTIVLDDGTKHDAWFRFV